MNSHVRMALLGALVASPLVAPLSAQMPGAPVLQNAWATPGIVAAVNYGGGSDGSVIAGAAGWTPSNGRFQVSGGLGSRSLTGYGSGFAYGARVAVPLWGGGASSFGIGAFAGFGGATSSKKSSTSTTSIVTGTTTTPSAGTVDSTPSTTEIPLGAGIGWRHMLGATHGISVYATPAYVFLTGGTSNGGVVRLALGGDIGITSSIGATVGIDFGGTRARGLGGPSSTQYGLGVSYAFGRR